MLIIAHRGASGHALENTMPAFKLALEMGAKAVELDVWPSKDHELVVIHDADLKRTHRVRKRVRDLTARQLAEHGVPRLEEVFDLCEGKAEINVEIKGPGVEEAVVDLIQRRSAWKTTSVSSFNHASLYLVRTLDERIRLGYLRGITPMRTAYKEMKELKAESLNCSRRQVNKATVKACHDRGLKVLVYTVNDADEIARLDKLGVDGVFCNYPELRL